MKTLKLLFTSKKFVFGLCLFLTLLFLGLLFPVFNHKDPLDLAGFMYQKPSREFLLGTDNFGRDVLVELIHGLKTSMFIGLLAGTVATLIGVGIGLTAGYIGGWVDNLLNTITNIFLVVPPFVILILISVSLQNRSLGIMGLIIGITSWPWTARAVRAQATSLSVREHIDLAKISGMGTFEIMLREVLPYIMSYIFMAFVLQVASGILNEAGISMLGLGPSNIVSLGTMLSWALLFEAVRTGAWWAFIPPALTIAFITFSLLFMSTGMDEIFNPRLRS